jgi:hypothetical protein
MNIEKKHQNRIQILSSQILSKPVQKIIHFKKRLSLNNENLNENNIESNNEEKTIIFEESVKYALQNNLPVVALGIYKL